MTAEARLHRTGAIAALATILGVIVSGPLVLLLVPQPAWTGAADFAATYRPIHGLAFYGGFVLLCGLVALVATLHALADRELRARTTTAIVFASAFAALVFFNYIVQTTFVPQLVRNYSDADASIVATFAMANPHSLAWSIEMWAYGLLGVATWLVSPVFAGATRVDRAARLVFVANGAVSVATALATALIPDWVLSPIGIAGYVAWNILVVAMATLAFVVLRRPVERYAHAVGEPGRVDRRQT
jgi:hypothetical protein